MARTSAPITVVGPIQSVVNVAFPISADQEIGVAATSCASVVGSSVAASVSTPASAVVQATAVLETGLARLTGAIAPV